MLMLHNSHSLGLAEGKAGVDATMLIENDYMKREKRIILNLFELKYQ